MVRIPTLPLLALLAIFAVPAPAQTRVGPLLDAEGRPLEGGELRVDGVVVARTGADGFADIDDPEMRVQSFQVRAPGHAEYYVGRWPTDGLQLPRGTLLVGSVVDAGGHPVPDATIRVTDDLPTRGLVPTTGWPLAWHQLETRTDAEGRFRLTGALAFGARVEVRIAGMQSRERGAIDAGTPVDFVVPELVRIRGRIVDARGEPIDGTGSVLVRDGDTVIGGGTTGPDGGFDLRVPAGDYELEPQFTDLRLIPAVGDRVPLEAALGQLIDLRVPVEGTRLKLRAMADGAPVPAFTAWLSTTVPRWRSVLEHASENGEIRISPLPPGTELVARVEADGRGTSDHRITVPEADTDVAMELPPAMRISGRVVDPKSGDGVPRASIWSLPAEEWEGSPAARGKDPGGLGIRRGPDVHTDADGRFTLTDLGPGRCALVAFATGRAAFGGTVVATDEATASCEIRLSAVAELAGRITGVPAGVWLAHRAERDDGIDWPDAPYDPWSVTTADADGRFRLSGLRRTAGRLELLAPVPLRLGRPRVIATIEIPPGATTLEADVSDRIARVRGRVRITGTDVPLERLVIAFATRERSSTSNGFLALDEAVTFLDTDGRFELLGAARSCALLLVDPGTRVILHRVDLELGGGTLDLDPIDVALRRVRVRCQPVDALLPRVARIEVAQPWAYAGLGRLSCPPVPQPTEDQGGYDTGNGVDLPDPRGETSLWLPRDRPLVLIARSVYRSSDDRALGWIHVEPGAAPAEPLVIPLVDPDAR